MDEGGSVVAVPTDVTDEEQVDHLVERALEKYGRVDLLINNAAMNRAKPFEQTTLDDYDTIMQINLRGVYLCTRGCVSTHA